MFGEQNPMTTSFLYERLGNVATSLTNMGAKFVNESKAIYDKINDPMLLYKAKAALFNTQHIFNERGITHLSSATELQQANLNMQRWVMAQPDIRQLYHEQKCDGFSQSYVDYEPGKVGEHHRDYRLVMHEVVQYTKEGNMKVDTYYEDVLEGDVTLSLMDKANILSTWDLLSMFAKAGNDINDPTDILNGTL
jgi:hypothetical protein